MSLYDYSIPKYQQEDALPEGALTSVKKGQHVYIPDGGFGVWFPSRYECLTGGSFQPRVVRVHSSGAPRQFVQPEKKVIKAGGRDQHGMGNEFFFATEEECQRHIDRLREVRS